MKGFCFLFLFLCINVSFSGSFRPSKEKPVEIKAGRAIYKWEIKRLILENSNNVLPNITYDNSVLSANLMIYDDNLKKGFGYGKIYYEDKKERLIVTAEEAVYDEATKLITLTHNPKIIMKRDGTIARGDKILIYPEKEDIFLIGNVNITNTNYSISGKNANLNQNRKSFQIKKDVIFIQKDSKIYADRIALETGIRGNENYVADGNVRIHDEKENYSIYGNRLDYFKDDGYTRITGGYSNIHPKPTIEFEDKNSKASSIVMEKFDKEEKANLLGDVVIKQGNKRAKAMWGEYFIKKKFVILTGNPVIEDGNSIFTSYKISVDIEKETMNMVGRGKGRYLIND